MTTDLTFCPRCGSRLRQSTIILNASGRGFSLTVSGIPVFACDECRTSLHLLDIVCDLETVTTAVMDSLDKISPDGIGTPLSTRGHCRKCRIELPQVVDKGRGYFTSSAPIGRGWMAIGVQFQCDSISCKSCGTRHPLLPATLYHEVSQGLIRAASMYMQGY